MESDIQVVDWWERACPKLSLINDAWRDHCHKRRGGTRPYGGPEIPASPAPGIIWWYVNVAAWTTSAGVEIVAASGPEEARDLFEQLQEHQVDIERTFGGTLNWELGHNKTAYWVYWKNAVTGGFAASPTVQDNAIDALARAMKRLVAATEGIVPNLRI